MDKQSVRKGAKQVRDEGSVKPLGCDKQGRERYMVRVYVKTERNGKRIYKARTIVGTERQAQQLKRKMLAERDAGTLEIESTRDTFNDFLNRWFGTHATAVRERTNENDNDMIQLYVHDTIGKIKLSKLHVLDIQELYASLLKRSDKKPLSAATVRRLHAVIHHALEDAVRWELISTNPADRVTLPAAKSKPVEALDREQLNRFLSACDMDRLGIVFKFLLWTGVRPSEGLGLMWTDIDWSRNSATILRTLHHNRKGGGYRIEDAAKTNGSLRTIVIPANLMTDLRLWKAEQDRKIMKKGSKYNRLGLVFAQDNGEPIRQDNLVSRNFKPLTKFAELPHSFSLYGLRHTYATTALRAGVPTKVVSVNLGHADIALTLRTYAHVFDEQKNEAATKLENYVLGG